MLFLDEEELPSEMKTQDIIDPKVLRVPKEFTSNKRKSKIPRTKQPTNGHKSDRTIRLGKKPNTKLKTQLASKY